MRKKSRKEEEDRKEERRGDKEEWGHLVATRRRKVFPLPVLWASLETKVLVATVVSKGGEGAEGVVRGGGGRQREETGCHLIQEGESLRLPRSSPV